MKNREGKLTLKNSNQNTEGAFNPETVQNTQENERNINQQINTGSSPALYSKDQMLINNQTTPIQKQAQQNPNVVYNAQSQPVLITYSDPILSKPGIPTFLDINNATMKEGVPPKWLVGVYKPFETTCPVCSNNVMTVPETSWNCCAFFCVTFGGIACLGLPNLIRTCTGSACCCYDAIHKCPNCGIILAKRNALYK